MSRSLAMFMFLVMGLGLAGCGEDEPPGPKMDHVMVRNDSSTEANVRVKLWQKGYLAVSAGDSAKIEFKAEARTVQVEAKSRKQWDDCWVTMKVGDTLVIYDGVERIACKAE
ncbi:MAG: hypothetical protein HOH65_00670 [Rhodospirillaceae bacterium]|jgi:hypothetical protein|nr:hypothetical protein [Rhodospirillaceae bacterium]